MKKTIIVLTLGIFLLAGNLQAQDNGFEVGGIINTPTGISAKAWLNEDTAIDGALSFAVGDFNQVYLHSNLLFHSNALNSEMGLSDSNARAYYGAGLSYRASESDFHRVNIRFPGGITYTIGDTPLVTFFEIVPTLTVDPDVRFGLGGATGVRFRLN